MNLSMGVQSRDLLDQTLNHGLGSGLYLVLEVREPDCGQSNEKDIYRDDPEPDGDDHDNVFLFECLSHIIYHLF